MNRGWYKILANDGYFWYLYSLGPVHPMANSIPLFLAIREIGNDNYTYSRKSHEQNNLNWTVNKNIIEKITTEQINKSLKLHNIKFYN